MHPALPAIPDDRPILIAGATASGKSALALSIAEARGGIIVNADAMQVYDGFRILTARPDIADLTRAPHALYGHVSFTGDHSVGDWLRDVTPLLTGGIRPILVGGTGLYFRALTEGLADIPPTPPAIRAEADALPHETLLAHVRDEDPATADRIDTQNPVRVQRAWEVLRSTGRGLVSWQSETPPPLLPLSRAAPLLLTQAVEALNDRIARRFDAMIDLGVLTEVAAIRPDWDAAKGARKAIGAAELIAHLDGTLSLDDARRAAVTATRQYAKRQRTWFRARMGDWHPVTLG